MTTSKKFTNFALFVSVSLVGIALVSCSKSENYVHSVHADVTAVNSDDSDMNAAIDEARKSVRQFIATLQFPKANQSDFCVKKRFMQGEKVEHIWVSNVTFDGNKFHGEVANDSEEIAGVKLGDEVSVGLDELSDWMYLQNGKLVGGFTIKVIFLHDSPEEKTNFLNSIHFEMD